MIKSAADLAFKDISTYFKENGIQTAMTEKKETFIVTKEHVFTKESRDLNWQLGVNKVNYKGNRNGRTK